MREFLERPGSVHVFHNPCQHRRLGGLWRLRKTNKPATSETWLHGPQSVILGGFLAIWRTAVDGQSFFSLLKIHELQ